MEPENNQGKEEQIDRSAEYSTLEQRQLEDLYDAFKGDLDKFYNACKKQIQKSARDARECETTIKQQERAMEELRRKKSARDLLDSLGLSFARLYRTVVAIPDNVGVKKELLACIQQVNGEFENFGVSPIYTLSDGAIQNSARYDVKVCSAEDESQVGTRQLDKMGFEIEGEQTIKARCIEYPKDKFTRQDACHRGVGSYAESLPFQQKRDFQLERDSYTGQYSIIRFCSRSMLDTFEDLCDIERERKLSPYSSYIRLNMWYSLKSPTDRSKYALISRDERNKVNRLLLGIENNTLYLYLYLYSQIPFSPPKRALASIE